MKIIISPAKKLDSHIDFTNGSSKASFLNHSEILVKILKKYSVKELSKLMGISMNLAQLNVTRYQDWKTPFNLDNAKQAIFLFQGDVYKGMEASTFNRKELEFSQSNLRILSGLYGSLKPLDLIMPYRLEMGTKLPNKRGKNLYDFWSNILTDSLLSEMKPKEPLVNLASNEYSKSINFKSFNDNPVVTPIFKDFKNGKLKIISFFAKKARGYMCNFIIKNHLNNTDDLLQFNEEGYSFYSEESTIDKPVFVR